MQNPFQRRFCSLIIFKTIFFAKATSSWGKGWELTGARGKYEVTFSLSSIHDTHLIEVASYNKNSNKENRSEREHNLWTSSEYRCNFPLAKLSQTILYKLPPYFIYVCMYTVFVCGKILNKYLLQVLHQPPAPFLLLHLWQQTFI